MSLPTDTLLVRVAVSRVCSHVGRLITMVTNIIVFINPSGVIITSTVVNLQIMMNFDVIMMKC